MLFDNFQWRDQFLQAGTGFETLLQDVLITNHGSLNTTNAVKMFIAGLITGIVTSQGSKFQQVYVNDDFDEISVSSLYNGTQLSRVFQVKHLVSFGNLLGRDDSKNDLISKGDKFHQIKITRSRQFNVLLGSNQVHISSTDLNKTDYGPVANLSFPYTELKPIEFETRLNDSHSWQKVENSMQALFKLYKDLYRPNATQKKHILAFLAGALTTKQFSAKIQNEVLFATKLHSQYQVVVALVEEEDINVQIFSSGTSNWGDRGGLFHSALVSRQKRSATGLCQVKERPSLINAKLLQMTTPEFMVKLQQSTFVGKTLLIFNWLDNFVASKIMAFMQRPLVSGTMMVLNQMASFLMHAQMAMHAIGSIMNKDWNSLIVSLMWIGGSVGLGYVSQYILKNLPTAAQIGFFGFLGRSMGHLLGHVATAFMAWELVEAYEAYKKSGKEAPTSFKMTAWAVGLQLASLGLAIIGEMGIASFSAAGSFLASPVAVVAAVLFTLANIYRASETVEDLNKIIPLTDDEKNLVGLRAFTAASTYTYFFRMAREKQMQENIVEHIRHISVNMTNIKHFVMQTATFNLVQKYKRTYCSYPTHTYAAPSCNVIANDVEKSERYGKITTTYFDDMISDSDIDNFVDLQSESSTKYSRSFPDIKGGETLLCASHSDVPFDNALKKTLYTCRGALGISLAKPENGSVYIDAGNGSDIVKGMLDASNEIYISYGVKYVLGGNLNDTVVLHHTERKSELSDDTVSGVVDGGAGTDVFVVSDYDSADSTLFFRASARDFITMVTKQEATLHLRNFETLLGRPDIKDTVEAICGLERIEMRGGQSKALMDEILLRETADDCPFDIAIFVDSYTRVRSDTPRGNFQYVIQDFSGESEIHIDSGEDSKATHKLIFHSELEDVDRVNMTNKLTTDFFSDKKNMHLHVSNLGSGSPILFANETAVVISGTQVSFHRRLLNFGKGLKVSTPPCKAF